MLACVVARFCSARVAPFGAQVGVSRCSAPRRCYNLLVSHGFLKCFMARCISSRGFVGVCVRSAIRFYMECRLHVALRV